MNEAKVSALLGRTLTTTETTNFDLYLDIATENLESMLCISLSNNSGTREFDTREGYSTAFIDPFTAINEVTIDDSVIDESEYSTRQWDRRNARWYNSVVFGSKCNGTITVDADWGFGKCLPADLQLLLARSFDQVSRANESISDGNVKRKEVEDFKIEFDTDLTQNDLFMQDNGATIRKYSLCNIGDIQHGDICYTDVNYYGTHPYYGRIYNGRI
jgi:hypothetical protein